MAEVRYSKNELNPLWGVTIPPRLSHTPDIQPMIVADGSIHKLRQQFVYDVDRRTEWELLWEGLPLEVHVAIREDIQNTLVLLLRIHCEWSVVVTAESTPASNSAESMNMEPLHVWTECRRTGNSLSRMSSRARGSGLALPA